MSACASIQIRPSVCRACGNAATRPPPCRWRRNDRRPAPAALAPHPSACSTMAASRSQVAAICGRYLRGASRLGQAFRAVPPARCPGPPPRSPGSASALVQIGDAHRRRAHVDAAAARAQIERRSDDGDVRLLHSSDRPTSHSTAAAGRACAETRWSRGCAPGRRSRPRTRSMPMPKTAVRHACRTCAGRGTSRRLPAAVGALRCAAAADRRSWMRWPPPMISP